MRKAAILTSGVPLDARTASRHFAEAVADRVLDAQHREVDALQRAALGVRRHADSVVGTEPLLPRRLERHFVDVAAVPVLPVRDAQENAARKARVKTGGHAEGGVALEEDTSLLRMDALGAETVQFVGKQRFKAVRRDGVVGKGHVENE